MSYHSGGEVNECAELQLGKSNTGTSSAAYISNNEVQHPNKIQFNLIFESSSDS